MANTYYKILQNRITCDYEEKIISGVHNELHDISAGLGENLYDMVSNIKSNAVKGKDIDINVLLKYYVVSQMIKENKLAEIEEDNIALVETSNPKFRKDENGAYYTKEDNKWVINENVVSVDDLGGYKIKEKLGCSSYKALKSYNNEDIVTEVQVTDSIGHVVKDCWQVVEFLGFKKELVYQHKYSGICGESKDLIASVLNKLVSPKVSGYYLNKRGEYYLWNNSKNSFVRAQKMENKSPYLIDYEFKNEKTVLRKEYTGITLR